MAGSDVLVNLRSPTMGETSGTAIRALSLGKPLVVSDVGWFSELPGDVALKVAGHGDEVETLAAALELLATRPDVRAAMGAAARELARREHGVERVAELYVAALERSARWGRLDDGVLREVSTAAADVGISADSAEARRVAPRLAEVELGGRALRAGPPGSLARGNRGRLVRRSVPGSARGMVAPFIMVDELIWSELARGFAADG